MKIMRRITNNFSIYQDSNSQLGTGQFGTVVIGFYHQERIDAAVKIISPSILNKYRLLFDREIDVLNKLNSLQNIQKNNIVKFYGWTVKQQGGYLFFQLCKETLNDILALRPPSEKQTIIYFKQMMQGLTFLHSNNIIHRDLKPQNILSDENDVLKLADFGLSRQILPNLDGNSLKMTQKVGNYAYQAPQSRTKEYDARCDVWSMGLILYQMLTGTLCREYDIISSQGIDRRNEDLKNNKINLIFNGFESIWQRLLKKMLVYDYNKRATSIDILIQFLQWQKQYQSKQSKQILIGQQGNMKKLFKTFTQYQKQIEQNKKQVLNNEIKQIKQIKQINNLSLYEQQQQDNNHNKLLLSLKQDSFNSISNYIQYLNYSHNYKRYSQLISQSLLLLKHNSQIIKNKYNSFFILTICFYMDTIVYLKYTQLQIQIKKLLQYHPIFKQQLQKLSQQQKQQYNNLINKIHQNINYYNQTLKDKINKRLKYQNNYKIQYKLSFKYLHHILIDHQQITFKNILYHLKKLLSEINLNPTLQEINKLSNDQIKAIFLLKQVLIVSQDLSNAYQILTNQTLINNKYRLRNLPINQIKNYILTNDY